MLWAKSGNRCFLCKVELVQQPDQLTKNVIIGEECHIVSQKKDGPRGSYSYTGDFDSYDNLVLLCANHHKIVDDQTEVYTVEFLLLGKGLHENWVKTTLERDVSAFNNDEYNIKSLAKIKNGKALVDIITGNHAHQFDHDELKTKEEAEKIGGLFDLLRDWGDVMSDVSMSERTQLSVDLNDELDTLKQLEFVLFGLQRKMRINDATKSLITITYLVAARQDNPSIVGDFLIMRFPKQVNFTF